MFRLIPPRAESVRVSDPFNTPDPARAPDAVRVSELTVAERLERLQSRLPIATSELEHLEISAPADAASDMAPEAETPPVYGDDQVGGTAEFNRLWIDNDGQLYCDGKPVEVRRRLIMSPAQILSAGLVAIVIAIGATGAAVQGALAAHELACKLGWIKSFCVATSPPPPAPPAAVRSDIPA